MTIKILVSDVTAAAGTERAVVNLANNLATHGHQVAVVSIYTAEGKPYYDLDDRVTISHLKVKQSKFLMIRILTGFLKAFWALNCNINKSGEVVIGTNHVHNFLLGIIKLIKPANKVIGCEHLSFTALTQYSKVLAKVLYRYLDCLVVLTDEDKVKFAEYIGGLRCETIPNELPFYPAAPSPCDEKKLLAIGRFTYQKGFDLLIDIVAEVFKSTPDWTLSIIGSGEHEDQLQKQIALKQMDNRILLLPPTAHILDFYLQSSIYLMTSRYEGLPMVLLEAKACGLPIIAYDCPTGPSVLIKANDGILIENNNKTSFKQNLVSLMKDPQKRKALGSAARQNSLEYSRENVYKKWDRLLISL